MFQKTIILLIAALLIAIPLQGISYAQNNIDAPNYVQYCDRTLREHSNDALIPALSAVESQILQVEAFLATFDSGNLIFLEAISLAEEAIVVWNDTPRIQCLSPFNADMTHALDELLIAMLYGQVTDTNAFAAHRNVATTLFGRIRQETQAAISYLQTTPIPTPEPVVVAEDTPDPTEELPPADTEAQPRSNEELSDILIADLPANGVTVLRDAGVQVFPENTLVVVRLDRFVSSDGQEFDLANSLFTFDVLSQIMADWPELADVSRIAIETYDGTIRTLYAEASGDNFRAYFYDAVITEEAFTADLILQEADTPE